MISSKLQIRDACAQDMAAVQALYAHYVLHSSATFEEIPPSVEQMQERLRQIHELGFPYLVADLQGQIVGYCYAAPYRPRPAYRYTIENSIYVASTHPRQGIGHALMEQLIKQCEQGPWRQMIAVIAGRDNGGSIALHRSLGFKDAGVQHATGYKFGRWIDVVFMQRALGDGDRSAPAAMGRH